MDMDVLLDGDAAGWGAGGGESSNDTVIDIWSWQDESGVFNPYDPATTLLLCAWQPGMAPVQVVGGRWEVDPSTMTQRNMQTGVQRVVAVAPATNTETVFNNVVATLEGLAGMLYSDALGGSATSLLQVSSAFSAFSTRVRRSSRTSGFDDDMRDSIMGLEEEVRAGLAHASQAIAGSVTATKRGDSSSAEPSIVYEYLSAPWSELGVIVYSRSNNGRERREQGVRWLVTDVVI